MPNNECRRQRIEDRRQRFDCAPTEGASSDCKSEGRGPTALQQRELRRIVNQRTEVGGQKTEDRRQRSEVRDQCLLLDLGLLNCEPISGKDRGGEVR